MRAFSLLASVAAAAAVQITDIQGPALRSPLNGQNVSDVIGVVTAKGDNGFWISGNKTLDVRRSSGLFVFTTSATVQKQVNVGDLISLSGKVSDFISTSKSAVSEADIVGTELTSPANIKVISSNNTLTPVVIGEERHPPTQALSALDTGADGWLSVPNNQSLISTVNATLSPTEFGMDFWASLEGQLVTIPKPVAIDFGNSFGEFWVHGDWNVTGKNGRGGLTITIGPDGLPDANPETVIIGTPLDKTKNPDVAVGTTLTDITGVVQYQFGFFYVVPLTAPTVLTSPDPTIPPTTLTSDAYDACSITIGDYNIENMAPNSTHLPVVASHIATKLLMPDIMFVQEVQDDDGPTNDGVVSSDQTLFTIADAIHQISGELYDFVTINPVDGQDGGQPGGNIRQAFLYKPSKLSLVNGRVGGSLDAVNATSQDGKPHLNFNPGRIDPTNNAWDASRKPLVAHWQTPGGQELFTVNLHLTSKGGSTSTQGNARPPVNKGVDKRTEQVQLTAAFVDSLLSINNDTNIVVAGDCNDYAQTRSVFSALNSLLSEVDEVANIPLVERYTYVFDQNTEQLDHMFVSSPIVQRGVEVEHIHVNNWVSQLSLRASDHDPTVAKIRLC